MKGEVLNVALTRCGKQILELCSNYYVDNIQLYHYIPRLVNATLGTSP